MLKILQVLTDTNIGGAGIWLLNFLSSHNRDSLDISVVLPKNSMLKERLEEIDIRVIEAEGIADSSFSVSGIKSLSEIFEREKPDIVHTHASLSARIAAKKNKIKVVHTRHCLESPKKGIKRVVYRYINNKLSDTVIAVSEAVYKNLTADGIDPDKLKTVYNGIYMLEEIPIGKKLAIRESYGIDDKSIIVGMVARLEPVKNHHMFLNVAKVVSTICPEAVFMIVGDGSMRDELEKKARVEGIADKVVFTGFIEDVNDIMNVIDIHVLTSEKEALSISLIEAMSLGKPVIATNSGGPAEVIENGVNGIIVGNGDEVNLTMAITKCIQRSDVREKFGIAGKRIVQEKFFATDMAEQIEEVYYNLCQGKEEENEKEV